MKILVTGAAGFIGREFCALAAERGHSLRRVLRSAPAHAQGDVAVGDLEQRTDWSEALAGIDVVVHLAARVHKMREEVADPEQAYWRANVEVTRRLVEQAAAAGVRRFVFVSSIKVNGEKTSGRPFTEADEPAPLDPYGRTKLAAEQAVQQLAEAAGMEWVVLRPALVYGAGVGGNFARLMQLVVRGWPLPLGGLDAPRSFVSVWSFCELIELCCVQPAAKNEVFLAADTRLSTTGLVRQLAQAMHRPLRLLPVPAALWRGLACLPGLQPLLQRLGGELQVDAGKAARLLGWQPALPVDEALRRTAEAFLHARS